MSFSQMVHIRFTLWNLIALHLSMGFSFSLYGQIAESEFPTVPLIHNFNLEDYNAGVQNWDITQDSRGVIYVANNYGLLEFDGSDWSLISTQRGSRILSIFIDRDNTIYIGGQNQLGYLAPDASGKINFHSLDHLIPDEEKYIEDVWKVFKHNDLIAFNTSKYTYLYDGEKITSIPFESSGRSLFQVGSKLLANSVITGLHAWDNNQFLPLKNGHLLKNENLIEVLPYYKGGYLLFLSNGQIKIYKDGSLSDWSNELSDFFSQSLINSAYILSDNNIAVGTQNAGLAVLSPQGKLLRHLSKKKGLNSNTVYSIYQDESQNIWLGLSNGVSHIDYGSPFTIIDERLGLPGTGYTAEMHDNQLYLGTNNGLFSTRKGSSNDLIDDQSFELISNSAGQVYNIQSFSDKLLMSHHRGAFRVTNGSAKQIYGDVGFWKFAPLSDNIGLLGGTYEGFVKINNDLTGGTLIDGFDESSRVFHFENDSTVWMTHGFKGVFRIVFDKEFTKVCKEDYYGTEKGFPSDLLINVFNINDKLVFAAQRGVYEYNPATDRFDPYPKLETALGNTDYINTLSPDNLGNIYYIKKNRFGVLERNNFGDFEAQEKIFNTINKYLLTDDSENINVIDHENILIGAKEGFIHYDPTIVKTPSQDFKTLIRNIEVTGDSTYTLYSGGIIDSLGASKVGADFKSIRFRFSAPYFEGFLDTEYQYMLQGFDDDWSEWGKSNSKEYTNLSYATYTFKTRAKSLYGDISDSATYSFEIARPWYLTKLAYSAYFLLIIILFSMAMLWLDTKHKGDKKRMVINQKRAIHQKDIQLENVAKESEQRITQLRNEKLRAEVDFKNKELASSTMHLLNKNELMLDIKSKLEQLAKNAGSKPDEIKKIVKNIDRNISEDKGWDQFTKHFDQVHGDFLKKLKTKYPDLTPQETKLAAYLRMNLSSKDVAQLLNISVRGVEISRYRLRKKLQLERETNLVTFLMDV
ncbi:MAG: triple tyrosine motif-containing protein [Cyclobacteriaceae bacterium]